jgi:hypothetical protein
MTFSTQKMTSTNKKMPKDFKVRAENPVLDKSGRRGARNQAVVFR